MVIVVDPISSALFVSLAHDLVCHYVAIHWSAFISCVLEQLPTGQFPTG